MGRQEGWDGRCFKWDALHVCFQTFVSFPANDSPARKGIFWLKFGFGIFGITAVVQTPRCCCWESVGGLGMRRSLGRRSDSRGMNPIKNEQKTASCSAAETGRFRVIYLVSGLPHLLCPPPRWLKKTLAGSPIQPETAPFSQSYNLLVSEQRPPPSQGLSWVSLQNLKNWGENDHTEVKKGQAKKKLTKASR